MGFTRNNIIISTEWIFALAIMVLLFPIQWISAWCIASVIHEFGHIFALYILQIRPKSIRFELFGMRIDSENMNSRQEFICALAGPVAGFMVLSIARWIPRIAVCAFFQSVCNMLPIYPLDGGRALSSILRFVFQKNNIDRHTMFVERIALVIVGIITIWVTVSIHAGWIPICVFLFLLLKTLIIKIPCKRGRERVQ